MKAIIAVNDLNYIGLDGKLPWRCSDDLKHFKKLTMNCNCVAGYNTLKDLPDLPGRLVWEAKDNIIRLIERSPEIHKDTWCIGGAKTYDKMCHLFTELHISHINSDGVGDTSFPELVNLNPTCKIFHYYFEPNEKKKTSS